MQRFFDILFSSIAIIVLSPILLFVVVILLFTGEGCVFYSQMRLGQHGKMFGLLKFATMLKNSPNMQNGTITVKDDPRVLPVGKILRKTKINELPQLFNILVGDMSIIGPRPQTKRCFEAYPSSLMATIASVKPGLSGIGSIVYRNEEELMDSSNDPNHFYDNIIMPHKGALEAWYVNNKSISLYFRLILATLYVVIKSDTTFVWYKFKGLPEPDKSVMTDLGYYINN